MRHLKRLVPLAAVLLAGAGCDAAPHPLGRSDRAILTADLAQTRPAGQGMRFRPPASSRAVVSGARVGPWRCMRRRATSYGAHVELFAQERGVVVPGGIGVSRRCAYPLRTTDPTGIIQIDRPAGQPPPGLGELFALWGQPLARNRLGSFRGAVSAFLDGRRWDGDPRSIPLRRHAQIVLELEGFVAPHPSYRFPPGL